MSDDELIDPEVAADLALRDASEHDTERTRAMAGRLYNWTKPVTTDTWPCKRPGCKNRFPIDDDDKERLKIFNEKLGSRNEELIRPSQIAWCQECRAEWVASAAERRAKRNGETAALIRELKASRDPAGEVDTIRQLQTWGHPDVRGLVMAIGDAASGKGKRKTSKGDL